MGFIMITILPKWTVTYVRDDDKNDEKTVFVFAETVFQAWGNAMCLLQIVEKTEDFQIKSVNPKYTD